jgi:hypothetical protein
VLAAALLLLALQEPGTYASHFSIHEENDALAFDRTDFDYTQGLRIQLQFDALPDRPEDAPLDVLLLPHLFYGDDPLRAARFGGGVSVSQAVYTPRDIDSPVVDREDRPYAAWLSVGLRTIVTDRTAGRPGWQDVYELDLGMIGFRELAEDVQAAVHELLHTAEPRWTNSLPDEPSVMIGFDRRWIAELFSTPWGAGTFNAIAVPHVGVRLGSPFTEAHGGAKVLIGRNAPWQFNGGSPLGSSSAFSVDTGSGDLAQGTSLYLFAGFEVRAVLRNTFLDGTIFHDSRRVDREPLVADLTGGLAFRLGRSTLSLGQVFRTPELDDGPRFHNFGFLQVAIDLGF